jgi:hypothetical protein
MSYMAAFPSLTLNRRLYSSLCHKIYQQATVSILWLTAPPFFMWVHRAMSVFRMSCIFSLLIQGEWMQPETESLGSPCTGEGCLIPDSRHIQHSLWVWLGLYLADKSVCFE